jgi:acyl-CoA synthetase (NDP forming)
MDIVTQLKKFVEPGSVALFGISRYPREGGFHILQNLLNYGYRARIYPIHPEAEEILGVKTYRGVAEVAEDVDLAVINLPRSTVPGVARDCVERGISAIIIATQGFADANDMEGEQLQKEIDGIVRGKARVLGPNTFGTANAFIDFSSSFAELKMKRMPVGLICQSGVLYVGSPELRLLGKGIDLGNGCDLDFADALEYFEQDSDVRVIALHTEGMRDARRFLSVAKRVAQKKPIVALKTGRSGLAARAAQSHTGSLAGRDEIWEVALKQSGIIRVNDIDELADMVKTFSALPLMKGRRFAVLTYTGGFGVASIDACQKFGLELAELSPAMVGRLKEIFPPWLAVANPVDIWPATILSRRPMLKVFREALEILFSDLAVDAVLCICGIWESAVCSKFCQFTEGLAQDYPHKPLVWYIYGPLANEAKSELEDTDKTRVFSSPDRAIRALAHLADYSQYLGEF